MKHKEIHMNSLIGQIPLQYKIALAFSFGGVVGTAFIFGGVVGVVMSIILFWEGMNLEIIPCMEYGPSNQNIIAFNGICLNVQFS